MQKFLYFVSRVGLIVIGFMQNQPKFKAGVRPGNIDSMILAKIDCLIESRMVVAIKDSPDLIVLTERYLLGSTTPLLLIGLCVLGCFLRNRVGNTYTKIGFYFNHGV